MNLIKKSALALAALVAAGIINAQSNAAAKPAGALGIRYADVSFNLQDYRNFGDHGYGLSAAVNLPVLSNLDVNLSYGHSWLNSSFDLKGDVLGAAATYFTTVGNAKPFVGLGLGYEWDRLSSLGTTVRDDYGIWGAAVGFEVPVSVVTVTPSITYVDGFKSSVDYSLTYAVEGSYWFTKTVAGYANVSYNDPKGSGGESWNYTLGVRLKF